MTHFKIEVKDQPVLEALVELARRSDNLAPAMREISETMLDSVEESFDQETDPATGMPWQTLSPVTQALRTEKGSWPGKMLQISQGGLAASVQADSGDDYAEVGSNKPYARIQHLGGKAGRNRKVEIPARSYLGLWPEHQEEIVDVIQRHLLKNIQNG